MQNPYSVWTTIHVTGPRNIHEIMDGITEERGIISPQARNALLDHSSMLLRDEKTEYEYQVPLYKVSMASLGIQSPARFSEVCMRGTALGYKYPDAETVLYVLENTFTGTVSLNEHSGVLVFPYEHLFDHGKISAFTARKDERAFLLLTTLDGRKSFSPNFSRFSFIFTK